MKFSNKKFEWKKKSNFDDQNDLDSQMRRDRKKERRDKYKVKNQKVHLLGYDPNDEYGGMF
jgi:hypothetical protein